MIATLPMGWTNASFVGVMIVLVDVSIFSKLGINKKILTFLSVPLFLMTLSPTGVKGRASTKIERTPITYGLSSPPSTGKLM